MRCDTLRGTGCCNMADPAATPAPMPAPGVNPSPGESARDELAPAPTAVAPPPVPETPPLEPTAVHQPPHLAPQAAPPSGPEYGLDGDLNAAGLGGDAKPPAPKPNAAAALLGKAGTGGRAKGLWRKLKMTVNNMSFINQVGRMAETARPSALKELALKPEHSYSVAILPTVDEANATLTDLGVSKDSGSFGGAADVEDIVSPAVALTFTKALDVPDAGMERQISHVLLRACVYDRGQCVGNVATVAGKPATDAQGVPTWKFGDDDADKNDFHLLVRSSRKKPPTMGTAGAGGAGANLQIHVELNVVPVATAEDDAACVETDDTTGERKRTAQVDEICVAWGRCPWPDVFTGGSTSVDVQLSGASMDEPVALEPSKLAAKRASSMFRKFTDKGKLLAKGPTLSVKIASANYKNAELVNKLPRDVVCPSAMVPVLATFREMAAVEAAALGRRGVYQNTCNPTLRLLPTLMADETICHELIKAWRRTTARWPPAHLKDPRRRGETLDGLVLKFWPLLRSHAVPDPPVAGNVAAKQHREGIIRAFAEDHPVVAMSRNPDEWMHKPFDVAELAHNFGDPIECYA